MTTGELFTIESIDDDRVVFHIPDESVLRGLNVYEQVMARAREILVPRLGPDDCISMWLKRGESFTSLDTTVVAEVNRACGMMLGAPD